ncbi:MULTISPECIES: type IV pilus biogenesis protein PilM [Tatumella]|uniref:Type IV pilus biogenesis protein PilM n=1 Tax=Tatumella punctata TaxID=399969 RepID=A0ABW1VKT6_9GAMM|nr:MULTISPECIES: type IV pilus biogenesis protein PilM [unclassified Tatumella]MBS0855546.1 type IV pilus biogenesis protein PilM [Tatumella sp. JGM16]MBS0877072.1 type IV pilus biogenesis protein PilM [Tatumella sp. JGM82]MBS0890660.1 type IV pilus biogenesis protein PilM [Tatumella sp. JGM94]MBS0893332.1 type IV pilus biogenesis protein PilM [Tatumella sp. JGM130]MBS0901375.1 type IV pilus biogenesis protein PilM [Tatumella sp. JGM100]
MYYWILSVFLGGLLFSFLSPQEQVQTEISDQNCQRQAIFFLHAVARWQYSDADMPEKDISGEIILHYEQRGGQHFIWTADKPGLTGCLMLLSHHSRLFYTLRSQQLYDMEGKAVSIDIPPDISDGSIIYYYQE